jgi:hypothetical protein
VNHEVCIHTSRGMRRYVIDDTHICSSSATDVENKDSITLFIASYIALLADSPLGNEKPPHVYSKFLNSFRTKSIKEVIISFSSIAHKLVARPTMGASPSIGEWIPEMKDTPVFFEYHRYYHTGDLSLLKFLYTFLNFGKKLGYIDKSFEDAAFRSWTDVEQRLNDLVLPEDNVAILRRVLHAVLPDFSFTDFRPKFGPGSVYEKGVRSRIDKLKNLSYDGTIDRFFFRGVLGKFSQGEESGLSVEKVIPSPDRWNAASGVSSRISRLMFVPKNVKTARSICMEPNTLMFFQQGVMARMTELIETSCMGTSVRIRDQSYNQVLCHLGSYSGLIDTLDLSSASDSVSLDLVKRVFPYSWLVPMLSTRSTTVQTPLGIITPKKFAPMGSAICFPTQSILFCAVSYMAACLYTYEKEHPKTSLMDWLTENNIRRVISKFWNHKSLTIIGFQPLGVYGDDICIDSRLTDIVKSILSSLGFVVNNEKSFIGQQAFRESCGMYCFGGHDITPLYFTIEGVKEVTNPSHVASHVHLANEAWNREYKHLYRFLTSSILHWKSGLRVKRNPIPFTDSPDQFGILCKSPTNSHLRSRYNKAYQRDEVRSWTIVWTRKEPTGCAETYSALQSYEHMRWWAGRTEHSSEDSSSSTLLYDTGEPGLRWRWIPA